MLAEKFDRVRAHLRHRAACENVAFLWKKVRLNRCPVLTQSVNERLRVLLERHPLILLPVNEQDGGHALE